MMKVPVLNLSVRLYYGSTKESTISARPLKSRGP